MSLLDHIRVRVATAAELRDVDTLRDIALAAITDLERVTAAWDDLVRAEVTA